MAVSVPPLYAPSTVPALLVTFLVTILTMSSSSVKALAFSAPKHVVVVGGGVQGTSVAYHLATSSPSPPRVTLLESVGIASAASGKGGGFMAKTWGDGGPTERLHRLSYDAYATMSADLGCESYRELPVLSVAPGRSKNKNRSLSPAWLDGNVGRVSSLGGGAQITPDEFVRKMLERAGDGVRTMIGTCCGVDRDDDDDGVRGVAYEDAEGDRRTMECDAVVVSAGPWSCAAEDWFDGAVRLPMEGVKSTSIVWRARDDVDAAALFCGEDPRFGTHLEVYPRPDGSVYICGIGGSDYVPTEDLKAGAFRGQCDANERRAEAAVASFSEMSETYREKGFLEKTQACMRPCPPDALPYMGQIPGVRGAYVNAGHNCWGIAWAPACGKAMAELVTTGRSTDIDLTPFDPARFTKRAKGGRGRKKGAANVGEQW